MALVRGREPYTALAIAKETAVWGTLPTTPAWYTVPLISEDLNIDRQDLPETDEITSLGARAALETGRATVIGSITVRPRLDSAWWNMLLSNLGYELFLRDRWISGKTGGGAGTPGPTTSDTNTHVYSMHQAVPAGFSIRVFKSGPGTGGTMFTFSGCEVSELSFEQPNDNHAQATFTFIGRSLTAAAATLPAAVNGSVIMKLRDFDPTARGSGFDVPRLLYRDEGVWSHLDNLNTFTINFARGLDFDDPNVDSPDAIEKPGPQEQRDVTISLEGKYEQKGPTDAHPYHDFLNGIQSGFFAQYVSADATAAGDKYAMALFLPQISWTSGEANIDTGGTILYSAEGTALAPTGQNQATLWPGDNLAATTPNKLAIEPTSSEAYIAVTVGSEDDAEAAFGPGVAP